MRDPTSCDVIGASSRRFIAHRAFRPPIMNENLRWIWCLAAPTVFALLAFKKKSVSLDGAVAGWIVAFISALAGREFLLTLLFFFVSSTIFTKVGARHKLKIDAEYKVNGQRNCIQVFANGFAGTVASLLFILSEDPERRSLFASAFVGHYACCCGDTWASESGTAFIHKLLTTPILVTTLKPVPSGTNGGMSLLGTLASAAGGAAIGAVFSIASIGLWDPSRTILIGCAGGFGGSLLDSVLGALLQYSGIKGDQVFNTPGPGVTRICGANVLDNHQAIVVFSPNDALPWLTSCRVGCKELIEGGVGYG
jgi:uncharacterized protein (TIGR00297 family)